MLAILLQYILIIILFLATGVNLLLYLTCKLNFKICMHIQEKTQHIQDYPQFQASVRNLGTNVPWIRDVSAFHHYNKIYR